MRHRMTPHSHLYRLCHFTVLMLALHASDASAQESTSSPSPDEELALTAPDRIVTAEDAQTLNMLYRRNRRLSGRMAAYAVSLSVAAAGIPLVFGSFCIRECEGRFTTKGRAALGSMLSLLILGGVVGMTGLITAGSRRQRGQRRIRALTLTPTATLGRERAGGAAISLAW